MKDVSAEVIRTVRMSRGLSQEQMAADLDVSSNYISLLENGKKQPGMAFLENFSTKYDVPLIMLVKNMLIPEAKTPKEHEVREKVLKLMDDLEELFRQNHEGKRT